MGRGGRRENAGRRPVLDDLDRISVGAHCERLSRRALDARIDTEIAARTSTVSMEHDKVRDTPVGDRAKWLRSTASLDHGDNVRWALQTDQGIDVEEVDPTRMLTIPPLPRPKDGLRGEIATEVAKKWNISQRLVLECWSEYRKLAARLDE